MNISDVALTDRFSYDGEKCLEMYRDMDPDDGIAVNDFVTYLKRHVVMMVRKQYLKRIRRDVCEDLVQAALIELWQVAQKKKIPEQSAAVFHSFVNTVIRRRNAKTFTEVYDDNPKKMEALEYIAEGAARLPFGDEEELKVFRTDLPDVLRDRVLKLKWAPDERPAVEYILQEILEFQSQPVEPWMKREFEIVNPRALIDRVMLRLRSILYEIRPEIKFRTSTEKQNILHEGLEECISP
jgi:DNA-directed RNA polymerase specialized sigma24 family protein